MGVASYNRGSRAISVQFQREAFEKGLSSFSPDAVPAKPVPRPANWGGKVLDKAVALVHKQLRGAARVAAAQGSTVDVDAVLDELADYLWTQHNVARGTAARAVEVVRAEPRKNPRRVNPAPTDQPRVEAMVFETRTPGGSVWTYDTFIDGALAHHMWSRRRYTTVVVMPWDEGAWRIRKHTSSAAKPRRGEFGVPVRVWSESNARVRRPTHPTYYTGG